MGKAWGGGVLALIHPPWVTWFRGPFIVWGLAVIMLWMGITLSIDNRNSSEKWRSG